MPSLYQTFLPIIQDLNSYGGNFTGHHINRPVLDAVDAGAAADPSLEALRIALIDRITKWRGLQDHAAFSALFETYHEAVFYVVARNRGVALRSIKANVKDTKTPDFRTHGEPVVTFEVKTINVADPETTYDTTMEEGLDAKIAAQEQAKKTGLGMVTQIIAPHGPAKNRLEVVEQVMKKIDGNVKVDQYTTAPTFLIASIVRSAIHDRAENLWKWIPWPGETSCVSGQLFAIAAHQLDEPFYFFPEWGEHIENLGPLPRAGILHDRPFIAGLVFLVTYGNLARGREDDHSQDSRAIKEGYRLNGVWNTGWESNNNFDDKAAAAAKMLFEQLCHAWNDTEDTRRALLPTS